MCIRSQSIWYPSGFQAHARWLPSGSQILLNKQAHSIPSQVHTYLYKSSSLCRYQLQLRKKTLIIKVCNPTGTAQPAMLGVYIVITHLRASS